MKKECVEYLIGPETRQKLELTVSAAQNGEVEEGILSDGQNLYPIREGVPRILPAGMKRENREASEKTNLTFSEKWRRFSDYGFKEEERKFLFDWFQEKLGLKSFEDLRRFYSGRERILEVGPGSGYNTRFMAENTRGKVFAVDFALGAAMSTSRNTRAQANCYVFQADLMSLPFQDEMFDFIIADGVLHHTPDTREAVRALYRKLQPGGEMFFYVYRRMGPARQFCDEYIRERFMKLSPEECFKACEGLTELGRELSRLDARIHLDKPVGVLGIPAGSHDVQRLLYYYFVKCFWNEAFDYGTNNMVNYDWYHPQFAWQHDEDEVKGWLEELGVREYRFNPANPNGLSVLLRKPA